MIKNVNLLEPSDLRNDPVWEFANRDEPGETSVFPVETLPVPNLAGRVVGAQVLLSSGSEVWAKISNVDVFNLRATRHFLAISLWLQGRWNSLARYHDPDYARRGPDALAALLAFALMTFSQSSMISAVTARLTLPRLLDQSRGSQGRCFRTKRSSCLLYPNVLWSLHRPG